MDFELPEELRMLKATLRRFVDSELIPIERQTVTAEGEEIKPEYLARLERLLRCHHRGELPSPGVADESPRGRIEPADDAVPVDGVARDVHVLERSFDVAAYQPGFLRRHSRSLSPPGPGSLIRIG